MDSRFDYYPFAFLFCILFLTVIKTRLLRQKKNLPPGPFALPIIGHLHLLKKPFQRPLRALSAKYGPVMFLRFGSRPVLAVSSPGALEQVFTKNNDIAFANRPPCLAADYLTYNYSAVFWAPYGYTWGRQRRLTYTELLSSKRIHQSSCILMEEVGCLVRGLFKLPSGENKVDLKLLLSILANNVMLRLAVGQRFVQEEHAYTDLEKQIFLEYKKVIFPAIEMNICDFIPILRLIGFGGIEKTIQRTFRERDGYAQSLVDKVRSRSADLVNVKTGHESLVENLLSMQESEPNFYTDELIKTMITMMLVAGAGASAMTLEWAMSLLLTHPEAMRKLRAEIDSQVGDDQRLMNESDLPKLPYLKCVINETLRLYPVLSLMLPHFSSRACTVGGFEIPAGTVLMANLWALYRDPKVWEDPEEFRPERFEAALDEPKCSKFAPFGIGRRSCPGAGMGMHIASLTVGVLVQCFEWEKTGVQEDMEYGISTSLRKKIPLQALYTPRQHLLHLLSHV